MQEMTTVLATVIHDLFGADVKAELTRPEPQFGDYATNVALQLAGRVGKPPRGVAEQLVEKLREAYGERVSDITIAGPGFINIRLSDSALATAAEAAPTTPPQQFKGQVIVTEYSDPNPFKVLHAGHLYTSVVGDSISNVVEKAGGNVHRVNFGGDVGLHVGKTMWAILQELGGEHPEKLQDVPENGRSEWMAKCYVAGTKAYEDDETAKAEIIALNKRVYQLFADNDHESPFAHIYWTCRQWSYDYFNVFYKRIGTPFEKYYPESEVAPLGLQTVRDQQAKGVYEESNGAVVFDGEKYGLHTRVFINSQGLPTYEAKDVGVLMSKWRDYHFDRSIVITGNDIDEYMKVVLKSVEQYEPELARRTTHFTHGNVKLQGGVKMSSRKGNFLRAVDVLDAANEANRAATGRDDERAVLGAIKYAFLKQRIGADIIFDPKESVSLEGNSGPYLQYAHARARSVLVKGGTAAEHLAELDELERPLARKISEYPEVLEKSAREFMPHHICTYLYELAQIFNRFYEHAHVVGDPREAVRLKLVSLYADVLQDGLGLLGIAAPERM
ncbi:MAG TPA: arginine--tRNA ligase [Candidatus Saccharimonadales bacterium]|nr:arginine--tRNA ligase [Candidatus Saccharimonadales bacterium]